MAGTGRTRRGSVALFRAGELETIMKSRTIWICASCYACTMRCPSGIKITDIIYALKRTAMEKRLKAGAPQVQILAKLFVTNLRLYGRLHEGTLIGMYYARTGITKLAGYLPLVRTMLRTKRLPLFPKRIKGRRSLVRIIRKAQEIEMRHTPERLDYSPEFVGYRGLGTMALDQRKGE